MAVLRCKQCSKTYNHLTKHICAKAPTQESSCDYNSDDEFLGAVVGASVAQAIVQSVATDNCIPEPCNDPGNSSFCDTSYDSSCDTIW